MAAGVCKRFAIAPPVPNATRLFRLRAWVRKFVRKTWTPLDCFEDVTVATWLASTPYPLWRKNELAREWVRCGGMLAANDFVCKSFPKDETYPEFKHIRGINSRTDAFKIKVGPIFKAIEKIVYSHPSFIKHVPVHLRPQYIVGMLDMVGGKFLATDYTAFESLFIKEIMRSVEFELYDYMTAQLPEHDEFMSLCNNVLAGRNHCQYKYFSVDLEATRMSGEMCTSLGNGFSNLMFMLFLCDELGSIVKGVVEGDDGLFVISGPLPSKADFESLGLIIKLEVHDRISEASFCGIIFDEYEKRNIRDPCRVLMTFGWTGSSFARSNDRKKMALLRCKALSLAYQYPGCPIVQALANYGLRVTQDVGKYALWRIVNSKGVNEYQRGVLIAALRNPVPLCPVGPRSRILVENKFGIAVEAQIKFEQYLEGLDSLQPLTVGVLSSYMKPEWRDYAAKYVMPAPSDLRHPDIPTRQVWAVQEVRDKTGW